MGEHAGYLIAGYGITWAALLWYAWRVRRRSREAARALERREGAGEGTRDGTRVSQGGETGLSPNR